MKTKFISILAGALALAACDAKTPANPEMLRGRNFVANIDGVPVTLSFSPDEMRMYGRVVNNYNGFYTAEGNKISFGDNIASTMMMGPQDAMNAEREYYQFLSTVSEYDLSGKKLTLTGNGREMVFEQVDTVE